MDLLKKRRKIVKGKITRIFNVVNAKIDSEEYEITDLEIYKQQINDIRLELNNIHSEIMIECDSKEEEAQFEEFDDLSTKMDNVDICVARAMAAKTKLVDTSTVSVSRPAKGSSDACLKLPPFELLPFDGQIGNWLSFKELFVTSIDNNSELSDLQKLQYLFSALKNSSALKLISGFTLSEENYKHAWETLVSRYDNKKELAFAQISKLFSFKQVKYCSSKSIFEILDTCNEALRILRTLGLELNSMVEIMLIHIILSKFDDMLKQSWELSLNSQDIPKYSDFVNFLEKQAKCIQSKDMGNSVEIKQKFFPKKSVVNSAIVDKQEIQCAVCKEKHPIFKCQVFSNMSLDDRWKWVKSQKLCTNCLRKNHYVQKCLSSSGCKSCHKKHNTLLHRFYTNPNSYQNVNNAANFDINKSASNANVPSYENVTQTQDNVQLSTTCCTNSSTECHTLLSTALIKVKNAQGNFIICRALVDNGSQKSLISKKCCEKLQLTETLTKHSITGINKTIVESSLSEVLLNFKPHFNEHTFQTSALVVNVITTDLPNFGFTSWNWPHLHGLILADPTFACSSPIDVLIGADLYAEIILGQPILGAKGTPAALNSKLGWLVSGRIFSNVKQEKSFINCHVVANLDTQLKQFWELEALPTADLKSKEDTDCEAFFESTVVRDISGRYTVRMPFKSQTEFGDSATQAIRRFNYLETKLDKDISLKTQYSSFMAEYIQLGHMEIVSNDQLDKIQSFYLPHHFVMKEDSVTTKLRVVFDASAKDTSGKSLNDTLHIGPRLQPELFQLLLKFRTFPIALTADIEKMFRQIRMQHNDSEYQRIFWRFNSDEPIQVYRLNTVTYGTACAPYLAVKTLYQLAKDEADRFPNASNVLKHDFYVDDLLSGANSISDAKQLVKDLNDLLNAGGFNLRKWASNCPDVLTDVPDLSKASHNDINIQETHSQNILGLKWNHKQDTLQIKITDKHFVKSKRQLLSAIAKIFDPLGFLSPTTILLKIMMQQLWKDKLGWDENIPKKILDTWQTFCEEINFLRELQIPRYLNSGTIQKHNIQLHGFCDASAKAYSAVIYLRVENLDEVNVFLIAAKTRVAPLKSVSLPRLELCAALLLAKLHKAITNSIEPVWTKTFLWSDSEITLCWLNSDSLKDQFVKNRVSLINSLVERTSWNHVSGSINPADCASRGISPKKLKNHNLWWKGPAWLSESNFSAPTPKVHQTTIQEFQCISENLTHTVAVNDTKSQDLFQKYSSFSKLIRIFAWCRRFVYNARKCPENRLKGTLRADELNQTLLCIIKQIQHAEFNSEIRSLESKSALPKNSQYLPLSLFLDNDKILRIGGRLRHSSLTNDAKHPILLPKSHFLVKLIINYYHKLSLHSGTSVVLSLIRQKFWFVAGRDTVRKVLKNCLICFKINARTSSQLMGNLPKDRVTPSRPFQNVGVDFAGPITTKPNLPRTKTRLKSYIALFICFATKAVHLELVSSLSTEAFIACLHRFISRRGFPSNIYSDNGTNFRGADNYLKELNRTLKGNPIQDFIAERAITWHFNPPGAPHFGGLWEANIKSTKRHLAKICNAAILSFEELYTLLTQIEACLNSRPIVPLSSDSNDLESLTPGHFLVGAPLMCLPDVNPSPSMTLKSRWALLQVLRNRFWSRWSQDYLHSLQPRSKWTNATSNMQIGDLVLLKEDLSQTPLKWSLARICDVSPGDDGHVRVVTVKTGNKVFKRPITKICPLPMDDTPPLPRREDV